MSMHLVAIAGIGDPAVGGSACPLCLPSGDSAQRLVAGDMSAAPMAALHWLGRSALIGLGIFAAGFRGAQVVKGALFGGAAVEVFVLAWAASSNRSA